MKRSEIRSLADKRVAAAEKKAIEFAHDALAANQIRNRALAEVEDIRRRLEDAVEDTEILRAKLAAAEAAVQDLRTKTGVQRLEAELAAANARAAEAEAEAGGLRASYDALHEEHRRLRIDFDGTRSGPRP
jgi:predicted nuclease with TOPRIM domain